MVVENVNGTELRFKNPGSLLLVVIAFAFWALGFLDLLGHTSAEPDVFGLYSLPFFLFLIFHGSATAVWIILFVNSNLLSRLGDQVTSIQGNTRFVLILLAGLGFALWVVFEWDRWARLPGLQLSVFGLVSLAILILLFAGWSENSGQQVWRKALGYPLMALVAVEIILQLTAWFGVLPSVSRLGGDFYPYERVYYSNGEILQNDFANRYGWYNPDIRMDANKKRILIVGGSYVQALQVPREQHVDVHLSERINDEDADAASQTEIVSIGLPSFGLTPFISGDYLNELPNLVRFDEMIIFYHLGDDFQSPVSTDNSLRYTIADTNELEVYPDDAQLRHDLTHYYLRGYMSFQLTETLRSNYLTPKVIASLARGNYVYPQSNDFDFPRLVGGVSDTYAVTEAGHAGIKATDIKIVPNGNNFMFAEGGDADRQDAIAFANSLLGNAQRIARENNITLRVVTVPMYPDAFYNTYQGNDWKPQVNGYDLFLPEQALVDIANEYEIPILPMGQYMLQDGLTVEQIQALYMPLGEGSLTPAGYKYYADAIYYALISDQK